MQNLHACITFLLLCGVVGLSSKLLTRQDQSLIAVAQDRASDTSQPVARRLEALQLLRSHGLAEPYLCTEEVVESMLQLASETKVPEVRVVIYRQLNGIEYSVIRKPLVEALLHDVSSEVREEAARSLGPLRDDPEVQDALVQAQQNDESKRVRKQAEASLAGESTLMPLGGTATNDGWESEQ